MKPRVLLVDDEPDVLRGLNLCLGRQYDITTAGDGMEGLRTVQSEDPFVVVLSDMRMPRMDGASFLTAVRRESPETVRMLLTGHSDISAAASAVNDGQIFRFLQKPCPPEMLREAFDAAVEHHRLVTAERVLLEDTLRGTVRVLTDVLALSNPVAFGRANRIKNLVLELATALEVEGSWQLEVAAMLSQIGCVSLPEDTAERYCRGTDLNPAERVMVARLPEITRDLLDRIPRLEPVLAILGPSVGSTSAPDDAGIALRRAIYMVAADFVTLEDRGLEDAIAQSALRSEKDRYDPLVLDTLESLRGESHDGVSLRPVFINEVTVGMVFAEDVYMKSGLLYVASGFEVTSSFVERVANLGEGVLKEPVMVSFSNPKTIMSSKPAVEVSQ